MKTNRFQSAPLCLEAAYAQMQNKESVEALLTTVTQQFNQLLQRVAPSALLLLRNTVDEVTPCNQDKNLVYFELIHREPKELT